MTNHGSRDFQPNCVISFFRLYLMLYARIVRFDVMDTVALFGNLGLEQTRAQYAKLIQNFKGKIL